jgi:REP element-mobilizing transposase RayT
MPNHIHGIIELSVVTTVGAENFPPNKNNGAKINNGANNYSPLPNQPFKSPSKTIGSVLRGFKIGVTKWVRQNTDIESVWQRNYYEHIIRNEHSYHTITQYVKNNPAKWTTDKFNIEIHRKKIRKGDL